ncbi:hypothetical protein BaRGS_00019556 [Batillaria attramentaria]|uniref:Uncharacterized protein n=1 Tax=Batillaria attramentaria TaxID=370345 RepID=A0ABD0KQI1_9CAEN
MGRSGFAIYGCLAALMSLIWNFIAASSPHWLDDKETLKMRVGPFTHCYYKSKHCGMMEEVNDVVDAQAFASVVHRHALMLSDKWDNLEARNAQRTEHSQDALDQNKTANMVEGLA